MKYRHLLISICLGIRAYAQTPDQLTESWLERKETSADYTEQAIPWSAYMQQPLNLNKASADELLLLPGVSQAMAENLIQHCRQYGPLLHLLELQTIPGWDIYTIQHFLPLITVDNAGQVTLKQLLKEGKHQVNMLYTRDFQLSEGYKGILPVYTGQPFRTMINYRYQAQNRIYFGFTGEKDEGEPWFTRKSTALFDFQSMHLLVKPNGIIKTLALGDFQAAFGQGLVFGNLFSTGKSSWVLNTQQLQQGFRPYRSVNENEFLRGAAISLQYKVFTCHLFASSLPIDANTSGDSAEAAFSSAITTGLHRTDKEISRKDAIMRTQQGVHLSYQGKSLMIGFTGVHHHFSSPLVKELKPYQVFVFTGSQQINTGMDYRYTYRNVQLYGEMAYHTGRLALLQGLTASLSSRLDINLVYRHYPPQYQAIYTAAFSENSTPQNEQGIYMGLSLRPHKYFTILHYYDIYRFTWLRYLVDAPSTGCDMLLETQYQPSRSTNIYLRFRHELNQKNAPGHPAHYDYLVAAKRTQFRIHASYMHMPRITLQTRAELSFYQKTGDKGQQGSLFFQDISWRPFKIPIMLQARFTWFNTPAYDSRIYVYENDLPFVYSVKAFMYSGTRYYLSFRYTFKKLLTCSLRYAHTRYTSVSSYGSGNDLVNSPLRNDFGILLRLNF